MSSSLRRLSVVRLYSLVRRAPAVERPARLNGLRVFLTGVGIAICAFAASAGASADAQNSPAATAARHGSCAQRQRAHRRGSLSQRIRRCGSQVRARLLPRTTAHVETWAFDDRCNGGAGASSALVRQWVTFAESNCGANARKARTNCHAGRTTYCDVMQYLDTDWNFTEGSVRLARATFGHWWLHEPTPNQGASIYSSTSGGGYLINQSKSAVRSFFRSYVRRHYNADDGLLMDWQSPSLPQELYYSTCGCSKTSEIRSSAALRTAHKQMSAALTHTSGAPFIQADNSLPPNPYLPQGFDMLNHSAGVDGWVAEGEPEQAGTLDPYYSTLLDQIAYIAQKTRGFVVLLSRANAGASYQQQSRRAQEALVLLGYSHGHLVDWSDLEQGSRNLAVWPEEGIYPTDPVQTMGAPGGRGCLAGRGRVCSRGGHNDVQVAPGVYRREFGACYRRGARFGGCAAIMNTRHSPVTVRSSWLRGSYGHQITFRGGDVQSGGKIDLMGAPFSAGSTTVGAQDAVLLAP
jgi:hypothetical protein